MSALIKAIRKLADWLDPCLDSYPRNYIPLLDKPDTDAGLLEAPAPYRKAIILQRVDLIEKRYVMRGDVLVLSSRGEKWCEAEIDKDMVVDHAVMYRFDDDLGFKHAIGCAFGEKAT